MSMYQLLIGCLNSRSFLSTPLVPLVPLDPVSSVSIFLFSDRRRSRMGIGLVSSIPCHPRDPSTSSIVPAGKMPLITMPHTMAAPGTMLIRPSLRGIYLDARWQGRCKRRVGQNVNLPISCKSLMPQSQCVCRCFHLSSLHQLVAICPS